MPGVTSKPSFGFLKRDWPIFAKDSRPAQLGFKESHLLYGIEYNCLHRHERTHKIFN